MGEDYNINLGDFSITTDRNGYGYTLTTNGISTQIITTDYLNNDWAYNGLYATEDNSLSEKIEKLEKENKELRRWLAETSTMVRQLIAERQLEKFKKENDKD